MENMEKYTNQQINELLDLLETNGYSIEPDGAEIEIGINPITRTSFLKSFQLRIIFEDV